MEVGGQTFYLQPTEEGADVVTENGSAGSGDDDEFDAEDFDKSEADKSEQSGSKAKRQSTFITKVDSKTVLKSDSKDNDDVGISVFKKSTKAVEPEKSSLTDISDNKKKEKKKKRKKRKKK